MPKLVQSPNGHLRHDNSNKSMNSQQTQSDHCSCQKVMDKINRQEIKMRPHCYFVAGSLLLALGLFLMIFLTIIFFSYAFLHLRVHEPFGYLNFGSLGWPAFWATFPWWLLILALTSLFFGIILIHRYDFTRKYNFGIIIAGVVGVSLICGFAIDELGINENKMPLCCYNHLSNGQFTNDSWLVGQVASYDDRKIDILTRAGKHTLVIWDEESLLPQGGKFILGDQVKLVGQWQDQIFYAQGIAINKGHFSATDCPCGDLK